MACDYAVCPDILQEILGALEVNPVRDVFANKEKMFEKWYGEGSPDSTNAFGKNWGGEILWINPPFNLFPQVLNKIVQDKAHAVIIVPYWRKKILYEGMGACGCSNQSSQGGGHV